jgi:hypothetical protein
MLQQNPKMPTNAFLKSCYHSLCRSFPLQVANLFDNTKGVASINKYLLTLDKSKEDQEFLKEVNKQLNNNKDKITRLNKRRGNDLAHTNLEIVEEILNDIPKEKRGQKSKEGIITGKEIIELLLFGEKIIKAIVVHELDKLIDPQNSILPIIKEDYEKAMGIETADNTG